MEDLKPIIARNIAALRQAAGMTQLDLAEALHYSDKAVSKWERGESIPDVTVLKQVADLFGVTVDRLLCEQPAQPQQPDAPDRTQTHQIITAISLVGVLAAAVVVFIVLQHWLVFICTLPAASVVWLVLNSLWFNRRRNYAIISCLMWTLLLAACLVCRHFGAPLWEMLLLGLPGQAIIWLCSRFGCGKGEQNDG